MRNLLVALVLLASASSYAAITAPTTGPSLPYPNDALVLLNSGRPGAVAKAQLGSQIITTKVQVLRARYDFAVIGGGTGLKILRDPGGKQAVIPAKAVVKQMICDVLTAPTSGGSATISMGVSSAVDLKAATAIASWTGEVAGIPVGTAGTSIKVGAANAAVTATIGTAALTAGKIDCFIEYYVGQ